ncbi:MAG TPA: septation protein IspZ [Caulobacteraceae bacterium]|jgi:intracellular septation protein|nr:septation protein IspZ [Caulobacteraceae bacterium]
MTDAAPGRPKPNPLVRACVDYAGAAAFLVGFLVTRNVVQASWWLVVGSAAALLVGFVVEKRVAFIPLLAGGAALVFGTLTVVFHDDRFVKMKPTALNLAFAVALLGGYAMGKSPVKLLMGEALSLSEAGWRRLTLRYGLFFLALAILNEAVWRTQPAATWVWFKFPGLAVLTLLFSFSQIPAILKDAKAMEAAARAVETQGD